VTEQNTPIDAAPRATTASRIGWTILIVATLYVCYFSHLSAIGFVGPDEPRYAWIARDMAESGDWVTPRLYGKPWFEKPVLYYWGAAFFFKLSGVQQIPSPSERPNAPLPPYGFSSAHPAEASPTSSTQSPPQSSSQPSTQPSAQALAYSQQQPVPSISAIPTPRFSAETAARLPSAISALLATLALAWLALRIYGSETSRWLLLLLPTTVGMIGFSHAAATDMPFSAMLTIAMVFAAVLLRLPVGAQHVAPHVRTMSPISDAALSVPPSQSSSAFYLTLILFGFFLGLAVLAKGPAAIILSGGAVFFWALFTKRWRDAFRLLHPVAIGSFCLTALPWYILCARRNPDFFRIFIIEHNFKRYLTPEFQHIQPFWYYIPVLLLAFFPWLALLLWSLFAGTRHLLQMKSLNPATAFFLCWSAFCILFFSTSHSKLPGYILPAIPAVGLLLCHSALTLGPVHRKSVAAFLFIFAGAAIITLLLLRVELGRAVRDIAMLRSMGIAILAIVVFTNGILGWTFSGKANKQNRIHLSALTTLPVVLVLLVSRGTFQWIDFSYFTAKSVASQLQADAIPSEKLFLMKSENRGWNYALNFYLRREIETWDPASTGEAYLLTGGPRRCGSILSQTLDCSETYFDTGGRRWWVLHVSPKKTTGRPAQ
jgi:4-amino-4-deoxy-L-arabinose transferase-like glycosyltransferase